MASPNTDDRLGPLISDTPAKASTYNIKLEGQHATIVQVHPDHADALYPQVSGQGNTHLFDYLFDKPPESLEAFRASLVQRAETTNPWTYTILLNQKNGPPEPVGMASLMRMDLPNRVIEIGSILYAPSLQKTVAATEVQYLFAKYVFEELGFRRYEWKCNALNKPSMRAASRLGFVHEGTFRQHMILKGRSRDTAWYSIVDADWEGVKQRFEGWLNKANFDESGRQKRRLEDFGKVEESV